MSADETRSDVDPREQVAADVNGFLRSVGAPTFLSVKPENIVLHIDGALVKMQIGDVRASVDIGRQSLMHLAMVRGLVDTGRALFGSR